MDGFSYSNIFATKGIEYLIIIAFLILLIPFWIAFNQKARKILKTSGIFSAGRSTTRRYSIQKIPRNLQKIDRTFIKSCPICKNLHFFYCCATLHLMLTVKKKEIIISKSQRHDSDTGSPEVQVAILSQKINELAAHL